jgi:hypothetical protein
MHGMLSAAVILVVFAVVAVVGGGSTVWLYRAAAGPSGRSRRSPENPEKVSDRAPETRSGASDPAALKTPETDSVADTRSDLPAPDFGPAAVEPDEEHDEASAETGDEEFEGARIYMLDSYPRSGR